MVCRCEPENPRRIGRSRVYSADDVAERLRRWHAPRNGRWERLTVLAGELMAEYLEPGGARCIALGQDEATWVAPGTRWRVAEMDARCRFQLEIHADSDADCLRDPERPPSALLDEAVRRAAGDVAALGELMRELPVGQHCIVECRFDVSLLTRDVWSSGTLSWHPLARERCLFRGLIVRTPQPFGLVEYLVRDHAVIEAALGGALSGNDECAHWLRATLDRHLRIEEALVFPAWMRAGGPPARVQGLMNEHKYLRCYVEQLGQPEGARRFARLLDGHDDKEERLVYPEVVDSLKTGAEDLLLDAMTCPCITDANLRR